MVTKHIKSLSIIVFIFFISFIFTSNIFAKSKFNLQNYIEGMFIGEDLDPKYGQYEEIIIPKGLYNESTLHVDLKKKSVEKVIFRFVKKKSSLTKYPSKAIEGIIWLELMYNEMIRYPKSVQPKTIKDIWQAREDIRKSMGFSNLSTQEVIDRYFLLSILLKDAKVEKQSLDRSLKKRKKILKNLKSEINKAKKDYLSSMDDLELAKFEKNNPFNKNNITTSDNNKQKPKNTSVIEPEITITSDLETKLIQLKDFFDKGLISEEEYNTKKQELLDEF